MRRVIDTAKEEIGKKKKRGLCALVSIDVCNAFNTVQWQRVLQAMEKINFPTYLLKIAASYLSYRWLLHGGQEY